MPDTLRLRLVEVEFLRPGPANNQLLSPLTPYLAICGNSGAGVVTVPYEHSWFERRLKELRYETGEPEGRPDMLHEIGEQMARILGAVPGLPGALDARGANTLIHLRLTLSASELALLPFELSKVPVSATASGESWLGIQASPPVCITRHVRTVSPERVGWPDKPRILFISASRDYVPYVEHRTELLKAIDPFRYPKKGHPTGTADAAQIDLPRQEYDGLLTVLLDPTIVDVLREFRSAPYTHVHILTHGEDDGTANTTYGLVLRGPDGSSHVVPGEQLASALTSVDDNEIRRPCVVTIASCDSGNVGSVVIPGASVAHALHLARIPFVIASQFPLSQEGSVPMVAELYEDLLWGRHPLMQVQRLRAGLLARYTTVWHDWASLVVYEALPATLDDQLDDLRYWQSRRAVNAALQRIDIGVEGDASWGELKGAEEAVEQALNRLPLEGHYSVECVGLRASARKRQAQAIFTAEARSGQPVRAKIDQYALLEQARLDYELACRKFVVNDARAVQRIATLHWVIVQYLSQSVVSAKSPREGTWEAALVASTMYLDHPNSEERAWAHGSLLELWLLRLALADDDSDRTLGGTWAERARDHATELVRIYPTCADFPVRSTHAQIDRYLTWWGTAAFAAGLTRREPRARLRWSKNPLFIKTAREILGILKPPPDGPGSEPTTTPESTPPSESGPAPSSGSPGPTPRPPLTGGDTLAHGQGARPRRPSTGHPATASRTLDRPFFNIQMLPAGHGDCLWIEYGKGEGDRTHRWLIDCGTRGTSPLLLDRVKAVPRNEWFLELFVLSHIDADHIGGALSFFRAVKDGLRFGDVWFNGWRHLSGQLGARQGEMFSTAIQDLELPWNVFYDGRAAVTNGKLPEYVLPGGMKLTLLSPTPATLGKLKAVWARELKKAGLVPGARADYAKFLKGAPSTSTDVDVLAATKFTGDNGAPNGTSIALLAEFGGTAALLTADAHAPLLVNSIRTLLESGGLSKLSVGAFKVSHHASQNNVSTELVELLDCPRYLISTNGDHFFHPDREAIARIIKSGGKHPSLYFNYRSRYNEVWEDSTLQRRYGYSTHYPPADHPGLTVSLLP